MKELPQNIKRLHSYEEKLREETLSMIEKEKDLIDHVDLIFTALDSIHIVVNKYKYEDDDELTIQLLGIRIFNSTVSSLKLLFSGYFQNSLILQRDILETGFLIDYFESNPGEISTWRGSSSKQRRKKYSPHEIRKSLDNRDKYEKTERKRIYQNMSAYGTHPDPEGFKMIKNQKYCKIGPFKNDFKTKALITELAKWCPLFALIFIDSFEIHDISIIKTHIDFLDKYSVWAKNYLNIESLTKEIAEMKDLLSEINDG